MAVLRFLKSIPCIVTIVLCSRCSADIIVDAYTHANNDRFSNSSSFIAAGFNLSGVGQAANGRWATAISDNVVISAEHFSPGGMVYFYPNNDPSATPVTRQVVSAAVMGRSDIWLGVLDQPLPANIAFYPIANQQLTGTPFNGMNPVFDNAGPYQNLNAYMFGLSPFDATISGDDRFTYNDQAVGRNRISGYTENIPITGINATDNDALVMVFDTSTLPDYVANEAFFQSGDSGGPTFVDISGQLTLIGTNLFADGIVINGVNTGVSGISYIGNYADEIRDFIQANAVPEPTISSLIVMMGMAITLRYRRRFESISR